MSTGKPQFTIVSADSNSLTAAQAIAKAKEVRVQADTPPRFTANFLQKLAKSILEELKNQKLDETVVQNILNTDPTQEKSYSLWLASQLKKKQIRLPEDSNQLKTQLQEFTKIKRSPTFTGAKDINKYSIGDLYELTRKKDVEVSKTQQVKDLIEKGNSQAKIVAKEGAFTLYEVTGAEEVTILGSNTNWCTTQLKAAKRNLSKGPIFIGYYQGNPYLQFNSEQCLNKKNEEVGDDKIAYTLLEMGFKHKIKVTYYWVASNPNALPASLAKDEDRNVRCNVTQNPNAPPASLAKTSALATPPDLNYSESAEPGDSKTARFLQVDEVRLYGKVALLEKELEELNHGRAANILVEDKKKEIEQARQAAESRTAELNEKHTGSTKTAVYAEEQWEDILQKHGYVLDESTESGWEDTLYLNPDIPNVKVLLHSAAESYYAVEVNDILVEHGTDSDKLWDTLENLPELAAGPKEEVKHDRELNEDDRVMMGIRAGAHEFDKNPTPKYDYEANGNDVVLITPKHKTKLLSGDKAEEFWVGLDHIDESVTDGTRDQQLQEFIKEFLDDEEYHIQVDASGVKKAATAFISGVEYSTEGKVSKLKVTTNPKLAKKFDRGEGVKVRLQLHNFKLKGNLKLR